MTLSQVQSLINASDLETSLKFEVQAYIELQADKLSRRNMQIKVEKKKVGDQYQYIQELKTKIAKLNQVAHDSGVKDKVINELNR